MADKKKAKKSPAVKTTNKQRTGKHSVRSAGAGKISGRGRAKDKGTQIKMVPADSGTRFQDFFEYSPVALWEEDISELRDYIAALRSEGVIDLGDYFERNPEEVIRCAGLVRVVAVNSTTLEMYEAPDQEALLQGLSQVFTAQSLDTFREIVLALSEGVQTYECETVNQTLTGKTINVLLKWIFVDSDDGDGDRVLLSTVNITEHKRAEDAVAASEEKCRFFIENVNDAVFIHSFDENGLPGPFKEVNGLACAWTGYSREELARMTPADLNCPDSQDHIPRVTEKLKTSGHALFETVWLKKDGGRVPVEVSTRTMKIRDTLYIVSLARDTTKRKKAEEALKKRKKQLAESQRIAHIGSWEHNMKTGEVFWSEELFRVIGLDPEKDPADFGLFFEMIHPDDQPLLRAAIDKTLRDRSPYSVDYRFIFRDGRTGIIHAQVELIQDNEGDFVVLSGTAQDITGRKQAEAALRESERRLRTLIDAIPDAVFFKDLAGRHIIANKANEKLFGLSPEMLAGKTAEDLLPPEIAAVCRMNDEEVLKRGRTVRCEEISRDKNGNKQVLDTIKVPLYDDDGNAMGLVGIVRDITERKQTEERIRQSDRFIRNVLDTVDEGFIVIDRDYRIMTANKAYCDQVGYAGDKLIGMHCYMVSHGNSCPCFEEGEECAVKYAFETGEPHSSLHKHHNNGNVLYIETKAYPLKDASGTVESVIETINNITEKHLLEEERLKTQKLESIGTLAGGIAHDFNNLLQGIFGYISMARMSLDREKSLSMLEQAEKALQQAVNLTTQLLTFSRGGQPVMKVIDLRPVIENATAFALSGNSSDCRISIDRDLWCVMADEGQLSQVIQNIVLNASQAMPLGGRVTVTARNIAAEDNDFPPSLAERDYVAIEIKDDGVGIPEQYLGKIFDPYFSTKEKGSGLGLATSYSIIRRHGGAITVDSRAGDGSSFTAYIPAAKTEAVVEAVRIRSTPPGTARILVMDDEEIVRNVAGELLDAIGYSAEFAAHGDAALAKYREARESARPFDVVILDLTIRGGMGGMETLRKLLEIDPDVKAVVSSGYSDDAVVAEYEYHGFKAFLKKPYNFDELRETLYPLL